MHIKRAAGCKLSLLHGTFALLLTFPSLCRAVLVNRTIDSEYGDPVTGFVPLYHSPQPAWADQTCGGCWIQPDRARAFDGTWMAATYHPELQNINFTLQFTGVAIWVFFILPNANDHGTVTTTNTQCNFTLDGQLVGEFSHDPDLSTYDMIYNATVFSQTGLTNTSHQLLISVNDYPISTFVNFDWAIYTADVDPSTIASTTSSSNTISSTAVASTSASQNTVTPSSNSSSKIGIIVGCVLGALALVAVVVMFFIFRRRSAPSKTQNLRPFDIDTPHITLMTETSHSFSPSTSDNTFQRPSFSTLPGSRRDQGSLPGSSPGGARASAMRQAEINERIMSAQREMNYLTSLQTPALAASESSSASSPSQREITALRHQIEELRNQIGHLQNQQQSGLIGDQPPAYG